MDQHMHDHPTDPESSFGRHGMAVAGEDNIFLSHLPMFQASDPARRHPHDYQVLLEVAFTKPEGAKELYLAHRRHLLVRLITLNPEPFNLTDLVSTDAARPPLRSFGATLFDGHFERGGKPFIEDLTVSVVNVVHFRKFDPKARPLAQLEYLLFGKPEGPSRADLFLAHLITRPPDFDQILSVSVPEHRFTDEQLSHGIRVSFPGRKNRFSEKLTVSEKVMGKIQVSGGQPGEAADIGLEVKKEFYFETGDLAQPM